MRKCASPGGGHYGVIAQEVEEVVPEIVSGGPDGAKTIVYSELIPILIEAIKTQQDQIAALQIEVQELRSLGIGER